MTGINQIKQYNYRGYSFNVRENNRGDKILDNIIRDERGKKSYEHIIAGKTHFLTFKGATQKAMKYIDIHLGV